MEDPNEPPVLPEGGGGDGEEPEQKSAREIQVVRHYINGLFALFDKNKDLIAKTLAYLSVPEIFVVTREATGDRAFSQHKKLWKMTATQKFGSKRIVELENLLTTTDPELPGTTPVLLPGAEIDYFRLMLSDFIVHKCVTFSPREQPSKLTNVSREEFIELRSYAAYNRVSNNVVFTLDGVHWTNFRFTETFYYNSKVSRRWQWQIECDSDRIKRMRFGINWIIKIIQSIFGLNWFRKIEHRPSNRVNVGICVIKGLPVSSFSEIAMFKLMYAILQIPNVSLSFDIKQNGKIVETLLLKDKVSL
jgi:hypothetical protein